MATEKSKALGLTLEDNEEFVGIETTAENFRILDEFIGSIKEKGLTSTDGKMVLDFVNRLQKITGDKGEYAAYSNDYVQFTDENLRQANFSAAGLRLGNPLFPDAIIAHDYAVLPMTLINADFSPDKITLAKGVTQVDSTETMAISAVEARCTGSAVQIRGHVKFTYRKGGAASMHLATLTVNNKLDDLTDMPDYLPAPKTTLLRIVPVNGSGFARIGVRSDGTINVYSIYDPAGQGVLSDGAEIKALSLDMEYPVDMA